jgi:hypothetical protein
VTAPPSPHGTGIFWAALLAFVLHALLALAGPALAPGLLARGAPLLSYALLGAFALSLGYVSGVVLGARRTGTPPVRGDVVRALVLGLLVVGHVALLVRRWLG